MMNAQARLLAASCLLLAAQGVAAQYPGQQPAQPPPGHPAAAATPPVQSQAQTPAGNWVTVERRAVGGGATVGGTVVPVEEITFTAQMPGSVKFIAGAEGDRFDQGQVLAVLDEAAMLAQRQAALAQIRNAESAQRNAAVQYDRERENPTPKQSGNMMSQMMPMPFMGDGGDNKVHRGATLYQYRSQIEQAQSGVVAARSQLAEIDAKLKDTKSVAPFAGYITHKHVNQGDTVQPGQPLLSFANMDQLQVQVDVPTRLAGPLHPGTLTQVRLDDPKQTVAQARVAQVFPMADATRHTVRVKFDLRPGTPAKAGMYADVMIPQAGGSEAAAEALPVIPMAAVVWRGGLPMVYVQDAQGQPRLNLLRLGEQVGDEVAVLTGLQGGERVLVGQ
jgi:multidrug efflux pump subunit AcrA (membrane-fusion protein)